MTEKQIPLHPGEHRTRQRIIETAIRLLSDADYGDDLLPALVAHTGYSDEKIRTFFPTSEDVVIALYHRFAADMESRIDELPDAPLADRFLAMMTLKQEMMEPYREALKRLSPKFLDRRNTLGVLSSETESIRIRVRAVLSAVIEGSTDNNARSSEHVSQTLYAAYLAIMWLWLRDPHRSETLSNAIARTISFSSPYLDTSAIQLPLRLFAAFQRTVVFDEDKTASTKATEMLTQLFAHRRLHPNAGSCGEVPCSRCFALHVPKAAYFVSTGQPLHLILPAFPAKSPNRKKTIGALPDMAEEQALIYLAEVCRKLRDIHPAGLRLTICSDGHVFSDLVDVPDDDVTAYGLELSRMIDRLGVGDVIETFSLTDVYQDLSYEQMRRHLNAHYEQSLETIRVRAARGEHHRAAVDGIHRFLFEDKVETASGRSRTQIRNECRDLAYEVVQRSDGWGRLLSDCFPMALRLSIHPQDPHSEKIGILLGDADDVWLTPWHGVAVRRNRSFKMMKRFEAESLGAKLVEADGDRGAFYEL